MKYLKQLIFLVLVSAFSVFIAFCGRPPVEAQLSNTIINDPLPDSIMIKASIVEGTYLCYKDGSVFKIGAKETIAFWNRATCPGSTTLGDGSKWNLIPGTCR